MKRSLISFGVVVTLFLSYGFLHADTIKMVDGSKKLKVKVIEEDIKKVTYKKGSLPQQSVPSDKVLEVLYDSGSNEYKTLMETYTNQDFGGAAGLFGEFADSLGDSQPALQSYCLFKSAECYQKVGDNGEAVKAYTYFANTFSNHRLYPDALQQRAICYINTQQLDKAKEGFALLEKQISKKGLDDYWKHVVDYWSIYLREQKRGENLDRVLDDYKALYEKVKTTYPKVANQSRLRIGRVLIKQKKSAQAMTFFNDIIENRFDADAEVVAGAFLGRGRCLFENTKRTPEETKSALYDFLRVVVSYKEVGSQQPEAMYYAGKCFQLLGGKDSAKRWQGLYRRLQKEWAGNFWAQQAGKEL